MVDILKMGELSAAMTGQTVAQTNRYRLAYALAKALQPGIGISKIYKALLCAPKKNNAPVVKDIIGL